VDGLALNGARRRHPFRTAATIAGGIVVVALVAALGLYVWLGSYTPLRSPSGDFAPGPGVGSVVQPVSGSLGRTVFFPTVKRSSFDTAFTLHNSGRFSVTVTGLVPATPDASPWIGPTVLLETTSATASADPKELAPFDSLRLEPGDSALVVVRFGLRCRGASAASPDVFADRLRLRYSYLSTFTRTQTVRLPFAVTLRCVGGPPASP
jgi:hypothetical protein